MNGSIKVITEKRSDAIDICNKAIVSNLKKMGVNVRAISLNSRAHKSFLANFFTEIISTIKIIFLIKHDDVVLFTDPLSFNTLASTFIHNRKYIIFYHYEKDPFYYKFIPFISYTKVLNGFDGIICISTFSLSQLDSLGINTDKCKVIYYGIDQNLFKPSSYLSPYSFEYILSVGSEEPRKNMKNILEAFNLLKKNFPELKLLKVGKVSAKNREQTNHHIEKLKLVDDVVFVGYIEENDLPKIYSSAKLLLFPSLLEGFGLPVVEAMACGCPVVTSNIDPMKELVNSERMIVNPLNPADIAMACKKIILDSEHRDSVINEGIERSKYFTWENTTKAVYSFITRE